MFVAPKRSLLERCVEAPERTSLRAYISNLQVGKIPNLDEVDEQLKTLIQEHTKVETQIVQLNLAGVEIAKSELGVADDTWLDRLSQMPTGKLPKVDEFINQMNPLLEQQLEILWKARFLKAIFDERYRGANFSLPRLVLQDEFKWVGTCTELGKPAYKMVMIMRVTEAGKIEGTLNWPTLGNSVTRLDGEIRENSVSFTERELIAGFGIGLPCEYKAELTGNTLAGTGTWNGKTIQFNVSLVIGDPATLPGN